MSTINDLPQEVINIILCTNSIGIQDIVNFASTCKHFRKMVIIEDNNAVWRRKFYQRWPRLKTICEEHMCKKYVDFKKLPKERINCEEELRYVLTEMSEKYFHNTYRSTYDGCIRFTVYRFARKETVNIYEEDFNLLLNKIGLSYYFLMDELTSLLERSQSGHKDELTNIYYGKKLLPYLKHNHLWNVWQEFMKRPVEQQLLEEVAIFFEQWCLPEKDISYSHIDTKLDNIVQQIMKRLKNEHPMHPIFWIPHKQFLFWKYNNSESQWNYNDGKQILDIVCKMLSENFHAVIYSEDAIFLPESIFINHVLEEKIGDMVMLAIIFQSVARRLGICCDLIPIFSPSLSNYCLLSWKPKYNMTNTDDEWYFYIDFFLDDTSLDQNNCLKFHASIREARCSIENFNTCRKNSAKLIRNLINCMQRKFEYNIRHRGEDIDIHTLELKHLIKPNDVNTIYLLSLRYDDKGRSIATLITALKKVACNYNISRATRAEAKVKLPFLLEMERKLICKVYKRKCKKPIKRVARKKFAVGMIVKLVQHSDRCPIIGVIYAWTKKDDWIGFGYNWHYSIIRDNYQGEWDWISQDALVKLNPPRPINNPEIGRFFCEFKDTYYMPNEMLAKEYPDDILYLSNKL